MLFFKEKLYRSPFLIAPSFGSNHGFLDSGLLLIGKLLKQGFPVHVSKVITVSMSQMTTAMFRLSFRSI